MIRMDYSSEWMIYPDLIDRYFLIYKNVMDELENNINVSSYP